jgi:multicomponent K+:H+ antiporter subunit F
MNLWVVIRAPKVADRILALDTMVINAISLIILYGVAYGTEVYFEAAMLIAMVGFISTVSYCRYILRGNIIE